MKQMEQRSENNRNRKRTAGEQQRNVHASSAPSPAGNGKKKKSACPFSKKCGGCTMIDLPMEEQLRRKQEWVKECIGAYGQTEPVIRMKNPYRYRNKVTSIFGLDRKGHPVCGVYRARSREIVPVKGCLIENRQADAIVQDIYHLLPSFKLRVYDPETGFGILRAVQIRTAHATGEILVTLVTAGPVFPSRNNLVKALIGQHPEITTIVQNIKENDSSMVLGNREKVLYGKGYIEDELCGKRFRISSRSFYQVNSIQTEKLYNIAIDAAGLTGKERVLDAYCGIGTIGICAADKAKEVLSVELNEDAASDAEENVQRNGLKNVRVYHEDAGQFMQEMAAQNESADVLLMDPPRSGATEDFLQAALVMQPKRIVYISCNPETLGRDLKVLTEGGYQMKKAIPVDMFPFTPEIETVCLLVRRNGLHIDIDVDVEEMLQEKRGQATYAQIRDYVLEQTGLKVSSLYISQVKRKCGLDVGENYNKPKSEDRKQAQCPPEKEEAILSALRHFGVI